MAKAGKRFGTGIYIGLAALTIAVAVVLLTTILSHRPAMSPIPDNIFSRTDSTARTKDTTQSVKQDYPGRKSGRSKKGTRRSPQPTSRNYFLSPDDE